MANKYIRHGETYCGDGTTSAAAASDGAVGAWNNINVFEGTAPAYGALAAGDTVYIRSKDVGGADITRTLTAHRDIGSASASATNPITWILDNGVTWSGVDGVLSFPSSGGNYTLTIRGYNNVIALSPDAIVTVTSNAWGSDNTPMIFGSGVYAKNIKIDLATWSQGYKVECRFSGAVIENLHIVCGNYGASSGPLFFGDGYTSGSNTLINPTIVVNGTYPGVGIFSSYAYSGECSFQVIGGKISGTAADNGAYLVKEAKYGIRFVGTQIPRTMRVGYGLGVCDRVEVVGCDGDGTGGYLNEAWGWATSRTDNYPPTLSATLPNGSLTPWAWRVYPQNVAPNAPMKLTCAKIFTDSAATKTITQEILVATTMPASKQSVWMTVEYLDNATGQPKHLDTRDFTAPALDTSTANWSATTWGMVNFNKRKLSVVTPTAVKPDTLIVVTLFGVVKSVTADDILFVDPDFSVA